MINQTVTNRAAAGLPLPRTTEVSSSRFVPYAVPDGRDAPVFRKGDYVVADRHDTVLVDGSIVLVEWSNGRRSLMSTRATAGEWSERGVSLRKDGPHLLWWFDPIIRPRSPAEAEEWIRSGRIIGTSDGPYRADHMEQKIIGRVVGLAAGPNVIEWAGKQCARHDRVADMRARKAAKVFDADLCIQLFDKLGHVMAIHDSPRGSGISARIIRGCASGEIDKVYQDYAPTFKAKSAGLDHANRKLEAALRKAGRVVTWREGQWHVDSRMPRHVRDAHMPEAK